MSLKSRIQAAEARVLRPVKANPLRDQIYGLEDVLPEDLFGAIHTLWTSDSLRFKSVRRLNSTTTPIISITLSGSDSDGSFTEDALSELGHFADSCRKHVPGFWCKLSPSGSGFELEIGGDRV